MRINKTFVDNVQLPQPTSTGKSTQAFYRDQAIPGFALRVTSGGAKSFIVEKRIQGKVRRITLGRYGNLTVEQARKEAQKLIGEVATGKDPISERKAKQTQRITLLEVFEDYLIVRKDLKASTLHDYRRNINYYLKDWQHKPLVDITKDMVERRHWELGKRSKARANNAMRVLRALFNHARAKYEDVQGNPILVANPVDRLGQSRAWYKDVRRQTLIKPHQLADWYAATLKLNNETTRDFLHFVLFTGLRKSEALKLEWAWVDLRERSVTIPETKNGRAHMLPLSSFLIELLERRRTTATGPYVFTSDRTGGHLVEPRTAVERVAELSGVPFTLHDLRRTFITIAESLDIPGYALKRLLNHKDSNDVTAGYIVPNVERLRKPMQAVTDFLLRNFKDKVPAEVIPLRKNPVTALN